MRLWWIFFCSQINYASIKRDRSTCFMIFNLRLQDFKIAKIVFSSEINTFCKITRPVNEWVLFLQVQIIDILFTPYLVLLLFRKDDDDDYLARFPFRHRFIIYLIYIISCHQFVRAWIVRCGVERQSIYSIHHIYCN